MCDDKNFMSKNEVPLSDLSKPELEKENQNSDETFKEVLIKSYQLNQSSVLKKASTYLRNDEALNVSAGANPYREDENDAANHGMSKSYSGDFDYRHTSFILDEEMNGLRDCDKIPYVSSDVLRSESNVCELGHNLVVERKWSPNFEFGDFQDVVDDFSNVGSNDRGWSSDGEETISGLKPTPRVQRNSTLKLDLSPIDSHKNNVHPKKVIASLEDDLENLKKVGYNLMLDHKTIPENTTTDLESLPHWDSQNKQTVYPLPIKQDEAKKVIDQETKEIIKLLDKKVDNLIKEVGQIKKCQPSIFKGLNKKFSKKNCGGPCKKQLLNGKQIEKFDKTQDKSGKTLCELVYSNGNYEKSTKKVCIKQKRREFIQKLTHELSEAPKKHGQRKTGRKASLSDLKEPIVYPVDKYKINNCKKQRCENLNEKFISLAQLKVLMPLLSKLEKFGKINGKELYEIVQSKEVQSKGLTMGKACDICCAWEKRAKKNNYKIEIEEALFAIYKPDDYLRIHALKNENIMKKAVVNWETEKYNDDLVAVEKQYPFDKPRSMYARPGPNYARQMNCSAGLTSKDISEYSLWIQAARVDGHSSFELEAFYKNAMKNIKRNIDHPEIIDKSPFSPLKVLPEINKLTNSINETKENERKFAMLK